MFKIEALNKIDSAGLDLLQDNGFTTKVTEGEAVEGYILRSASLHGKTFPSSLLAIARAGAGTNNIPLEDCAKEGIVVFNTPGANANAVKELVLCSMLLASRDIVSGIAWTKEEAKKTEDLPKAVEGGKSAFTGPELLGKTVGIMGLGAIGVLVANACYRLGMEVLGYDPYLSVNAALQLDRNIKVAKTPEEVYQQADYITIHVPYMDSTKHTINKDSLAQMKDGVRIVNLARGELVDDVAMLSALESGKVARYVTDFPNETILKGNKVIPLPHLGASTPDSERNCAIMAAKQLKDYLQNGNIVNSVNLPDVSMPRTGKARFCIIHKNVPNMLGQITGILAENSLNVENLMNKSRGEFACTLVDVSDVPSSAVSEKMKAISEVIRLIVLHD